VIKIFNTSAVDFVDPVSSITIAAGSFRRFATLQDALEVEALAAAISSGALKTDGYAGATLWVIDERENFGSEDVDTWSARPINKLVSVPSGVSSIAGDTFLLPAGYWSFSVHAAGKGNIRLVNTADDSVLATSTDGDGIITLYGLVLTPTPIYVMFETYLSVGDVDAPESEGDDPAGTKYTYLAAKFVCIE
jgi:hypothetical protein